MSTPPRHEADVYGTGTPTREAVERIAGRWTVLITHVLEGGPTRFNDLKNRLGVSGQVLARALRDLERDGLVARRVYPEVPVRVEYELTALGGTMCPVVQEIRRWAEVSAQAIGEARLAYDRGQRS
ncbi:winged helix-turn-helix transcriptional regulator [Streptomyces diastatochromogenes]|uniref:winged helix-turn-helix transcriptional regulator n=1 Tax=Streptomyces diastatochromogenes TaxID=42236 RepID=UPI00364D04D6